MNTFMLGFYLDDDTHHGRGRWKRRSDLYDCIRGLSERWWKDTTGLVVFETSCDIDELCDRIHANIASGADIVLVLTPDGKAARLIGHTDNREIFEMLPQLRKAELFNPGT